MEPPSHTRLHSWDRARRLWRNVVGFIEATVVSNQSQAFQIQVISIKERCRLTLSLVNFRLLQPIGHRADDLHRQCVLKSEYVAQVPIQLLRPQMFILSYLNQLSSYAHAAASATHATFEHVTHA